MRATHAAAGRHPLRERSANAAPRAAAPVAVKAAAARPAAARPAAARPAAARPAGRCAPPPGGHESKEHVRRSVRDVHLRDAAAKLLLGAAYCGSDSDSGGDDDHEFSEARALEEQMRYMQLRLQKIRQGMPANAGRPAATSAEGAEIHDMFGAAPLQQRQQQQQQKPPHSTAVSAPATPTRRDHATPTATTTQADSVSCNTYGTPRSKRTTLELRAASARSFVHLPPLDSKFKVLVVGNAKCGKTSVIKRFVSGTFSDAYKTTVGADFTKKVLDWAAVGDASVASAVKLQMWDIAGQDRFARLTRAYFNAARGAVVVCDVTREGTFEAAAEWKRELDRVLTTYDAAGKPCRIPIVLVANKADLLSDVTMSFVAGAKMETCCRQNGFAGWFVTSAKSGSNVDSAMQYLARQMLAKRDMSRAEALRSKAEAAKVLAGGAAPANGGGRTRAYYNGNGGVDNPYDSLPTPAQRKLRVRGQTARLANGGPQRRGAGRGPKKASACC